MLPYSRFPSGGPLSTYKTQPPWEFLFAASPYTLHSYELSRLNHAANLRKEIGGLLDQWLEKNACALLARWLIEQRDRSVRESLHAGAPADGAAPAAGAHDFVSDNFLGEGARPRDPI